jgi:hypothetical protein
MTRVRASTSIASPEFESSQHCWLPAVVPDVAAVRTTTDDGASDELPSAIHLGNAEGIPA